MAKLYNISNWDEQLWWNTGGTRDKKIYLNPNDNELYYFKQSFKKGKRDYKYEFWSEIVASEIGKMLEFDILNYDIAIRGEIVGCISKSMISQASEELIEGGKYLQAFDNTFNPESVKLRNQYNFELITQAFFSFNKEKYLKELIEIIVFDALIGNSDRHQENWAIINVHHLDNQNLIETHKTEPLPNWLKKLMQNLNPIKGKIQPEQINNARLLLTNKTRFAPIYDSGCCFGRELEDEKVSIMLSDEREVNKYVVKGLAEIHWEDKKISHFDLLEKLIEREEFKDLVLNPLKRIVNKFDSTQIKEAVYNIDKDLIKIANTANLPLERKKLIVKLLTLRQNKLEEIYSKYR